MGYRLLADENVETSTVEYLRTLGHDVVTVADAPPLDYGAADAAIAAYTRETDRLLLTQDVDFVAGSETAGVLVQIDQTLSPSEVGDVVHEIHRHLPQADVTVEYVSRNWL